MSGGWLGVRVLVTGAGGFIGSHLVERLVDLGASVRVLCRYGSSGSLGWLDTVDASVRGDLDIRLGDVRDARCCETACEGMDTVFHLAALISIPHSYEAPASYVSTNVIGTLNMLEGARRAGCRRMVQTSTSEVYGTPDTLPIRESHALRGQSPYSATKIAADKLCESFYRSFGTPVVTLRPFNTFGPRQSARAVVPAILGQLLAGRRQIALGSLEPTRDLTFVSDTVEGFVKAAETPGIEGDVIQLGTGRAVSIGDLFDLACGVVGVQAEVVREEGRMRPPSSEVMALLSDFSHARAVLGWEPRVDLHEGLARTADWLQRNGGGLATGSYHR